MNTTDPTLQRPPLPPFTAETAVEKVLMAENGWNTRDPEKVALAYTVDSWWRNRAEFIHGRPAIIDFLTRKWRKELDYRLIKELWAFTGNRIAVRFAYEVFPRLRAHVHANRGGEGMAAGDPCALRCPIGPDRSAVGG